MDYDYRQATHGVRRSSYMDTTAIANIDVMKDSTVDCIHYKECTRSISSCNKNCDRYNKNKP